MIKKIVTGILFLSVMASFATSETKIKYISPNNDGVKDSLEIPFKVSDKRIIKSWKLVIEDEQGKVVRTMGNKVALPVKVDVKGFLKQLVTPKKSVEIPPSVVWNGAMDNGEYAPDGKYFFYFVVENDLKENTTAKFPVIIDTKAPVITFKDGGEI